MRRAPRDDGTHLDLSAPIELIALSVTERTTRCRVLGTDRGITLRAGRIWDVVPGEIASKKREPINLHPPERVTRELLGHSRKFDIRHPHGGPPSRAMLSKMVGINRRPAEKRRNR